MNNRAMPISADAPPRIAPNAPFVLLDDARVEGAVDARLFSGATEVAVLEYAQDLPAYLRRISTWGAAGSYAAGYIGYDAAQPPVAQRVANDWPLAWFGRFETVERIAAADVPMLLPDPAGAATGALTPSIDYAAYERAITTILEHIRAGNIYQANLTFNASVAVHGHPLALYARLRARARAGYGGIVFTGTHWLLSFSPELFFSLRDGAIMARPMKGTATRSRDAVADAQRAATLARDPKQRAENLMIVDLLRNDLSRIAVPGSVRVPALFRVESYPTVHQMVSDITATLAPDTSIADILTALFPCGSITGAPKIRAMQIIRETEAAPRGAYTGSMGFIGPDGSAAFNVLIRTLALRAGERSATLGLGSGITADSTATEEWQECLAKGEFARVATPDYDLLETMRFDPESGIAFLERHLARISASARELGFVFDRHAARNRLQHATFRQDTPAKLRLRLSPSGSIAVEVRPLPTAPEQPVALSLTHLPVDAADIRLRHKTSDRGFYDRARAEVGGFDVVFVTTSGEVSEGSFTNVFVERDGQLLTPPLHTGLLPGVLRAELIEAGRAREEVLTPADLDGEFYIGNAVRGLIRATIANPPG